MFVTGAELARKVGVSRANVGQLTESGVLTRNRHGKYDLASNLEAWKRHEDSKQQGHKIVTLTGSLRAQLINEKIRRAKLENSEKERGLISASEIRQQVTRGFRQVASKLMSLASELADRKSTRELQS